MFNEPPKARFLVVLPFVLGLGCGGGEPRPPFQIGQVVEDEPPRPEIRILDPGGPIEIEPRGKFDCEVSLTIPEGGAPPTFLGASFRSGNRTHSPYPMKPAEKRGDNLYIFLGKLRAPRAPGKYRLEIKATYLFKQPETRDGSPGKATLERDEFRVIEAGPEVRVRPQVDGRRP